MSITINVKILKILRNHLEIVLQAELDKENFKCEHCDYETPSERGLNIHNKRKHITIQ